MSQTASPQAAPPPPAAAPVPAAATPVTASRADTGHVDTPALLNRWQLIGMSVAIVFGLLSAFVQFLGWQSDGRAAADSQQLQRVQTIQSSLLHADALATNSFLVGGLEDPGQRAKYDAEISTVLTEITKAADAQPADVDVLQDLNVAVTAYATAVAQARSNNRLGYPLGAEYLSDARSRLQDEATPIFDALVAANTDRAESAMAGQHPFWLLAVGLVALGGLFWLNQQLARTFRRRFNKGLVIAAAILVVVTLVAAAGALIRDSSNDSLRDNEFAAAVSLAETRTAANQAKSIESLRLIKRGGGATYEAQWQEAADRVAKGLARADAAAEWNVYTELHAGIVKEDDDGNWSAARTLATSNKDGSATQHFDAFDKATQTDADKQADIVRDELDSWSNIALALTLVTVLLGVAAAASVARGLGERRKEFA